MQVTVNGHSYILSPVQDRMNPDYIVQITPGGTAPIVGYLVWEGNGTTNHRYRVLDMYRECIGGGDGYTAALLLIDKLVHPT